MLSPLHVLYFNAGAAKTGVFRVAEQCIHHFDRLHDHYNHSPPHWHVDLLKCIERNYANSFQGHGRLIELSAVSSFSLEYLTGEVIINEA